MQNFQCIVFISTQTYREIFKFALRTYIIVHASLKYSQKSHQYTSAKRLLDKTSVVSLENGNKLAGV